MENLIYALQGLEDENNQTTEVAELINKLREYIYNKLDTKQKTVAYHFIDHCGGYLLEEINDSDIEDEEIKINGENLLILTDEEADEYTKNYIESMAWSFTNDFIIEHSSVLDYNEISENLLDRIKEHGELANDQVLAFIDDIDEFTESAIKCDGRGHFLATYDGHEHEYKIDDELMYIYRR